MTTPARLLFVTKNEFRDELDGGSQRTAAIVRELEGRDFVVDVITVRPPVSQIGPRAFSVSDFVAVFRLLGAALATRSLSVLKWFSPRAARLVAAAASSGKYDVLIVEYSQLAIYRLLFAGPAVLSMHNIEAELLRNYANSATTGLRRRVAGHEARRMAHLERTLGDRFDRVVTVSERDRDAVDPVGRFAVAAPNGVRDECFDHASARKAEVVFVAHLGWRPNIDAARWLVNEVWPHVRRTAPELTLRLVGRQPAPEVLALRQDGVEISADVPATIPFVGAAVVATAPLLAAGGTRLKILEAFAVGTPVVATSLGALGLEHLRGSSLRIEDSAEAFAEQVVAAARNDLGREAPRELVENFRWPSSLRPMVESVVGLLGTHSDD